MIRDVVSRLSLTFRIASVTRTPVFESKAPAGNRHPLLLAVGELGREMVHSRLEADHGESVRWSHRVLGDLGDKRDVLSGGEARDRVIELEYEPDVPAPVGGQPTVTESGELLILEE